MLFRSETYDECVALRRLLEGGEAPVTDRDGACRKVKKKVGRSRSKKNFEEYDKADLKAAARDNHDEPVGTAKGGRREASRSRDGEGVSIDVRGEKTNEGG